MKKQYINPCCQIQAISTSDVITLSDSLFGEMFSFGKLAGSEIEIN